MLCERAHFGGPYAMTMAAREATRRRILEIARDRFAAQGFMPSRPATSPARRRSRPGRSSTTSRPRRRSPRRSWPRPGPPLTPGRVAGIRWRRSSSRSSPPSCGALRPHRSCLGAVLETAIGPLATRRGDASEAMAPRAPGGRGPAPGGRRSSGDARPRIGTPLLDPLRRGAELRTNDASPNQETHSRCSTNR